VAVPPFARFRHRLARSAAPLLPLAVLSACTLGPADETPKPDWSPVSWLTGHPTPTAPVAANPATPPPSVPTEAPIDPNWWSLFHDDELTSLESRVAGANLDVRVAGVRLRESRAQLGVTAAGEYPTLEGTAAYTRQKISKEGVLSLEGSGTSTVPAPNTNGAGAVPNAAAGIYQPFNLFQTGFDSTWEVDFWGRVRKQVESAEASTTQSAEAQRDTLVQALAEVARDYLQLRGVQRDLEITQHNLDVAQRNLSLTQQRAAGGLTTDLDVANAAALVATISSQLPTLQSQEADLIDAIALLLGQPPQSLTAELATARPLPPVPPRVPVGVPSELARRRPDIREAEANLHAATADIGVAVADFYPKITLSGSVALQATQFKFLGTWGAANTWSFGPSLSVPLFEGGRLRRTLELRRAEQQEAAISYQRAVLRALHDVNTALTDYGAQQRRRDALLVAVQQNERAVKLAEERYSDGVADFLDVLDAQRSLLSAQQQANDSTTQIATNLVTLYKALGGGWETALPDTGPEGVPPLDLQKLAE
jgi:NodT family efflux transporter outer membrane factor (OMF) lipoprotein